jgi:methylmalonyl-CoA/ethylmalonyl-CoA epimerase
MKVHKVDHIGIAVKNLDESLRFFSGILGLQAEGMQVVVEQKVRVAFLPCGESELEILESIAPDGPIAKFIDKHGEGLQHIALRVENIEEALVELKEKGITLIDEKPRYGSHGAKIAFLHPKTIKGVLLELTEREEQDNTRQQAES